MNTLKHVVALLALAGLSLILSAHDVSAQSGAWTKKAILPTSGSAACVVNGKIYVVGGAGNYPGYNDMAANAMYDPATNTWTAKTPMNVARGFLSAAAVGDTIYAIGGGYPTSRDVVEAYDTRTDTWTTRAKMLSPRLGAQAVVLNGLIYNIGGNYTESNCEIYNPASNIWMPGKPIPNAGGVLSATVCNGLVYTFGGGVYGAQNAVFAYNPRTDTWTPKQSMPTARYAFRTYLVGGKIYAMGGAPAQNASTSIVEVYDPATDTWEGLPDMPAPLAWFAGAVVNDKIYVIGGTSDWYIMKSDVWEFDPAFHTDVAAGNVSGVWKLQNSPCLINGQITIPNDSTLTIEPGVEVVFLFGNLAATGKQLSLADDACDPLVSYNDIEGGKEGFGGPGAGGSYTGIYEKNIAADPALAEASGGHYHLSASSPCLSAGIGSITLGGVLVRAPLICFHGVPRPNPAGTRPDLGACESEFFNPAEEVNEHPDQLPMTFALAQNYPNPFNPTTTIRYSLPRRSHVILVVYNTVGQTVAELINGEIDAGSHEMLFNAGRLASGVYFYRLAAGDFRQTRAMLLSR